MRLFVKNFSCIKEADIEFEDLTIFVGPQASGKSVLAKLNHFFLSITQNAFSEIVSLGDYSQFQEKIKAEFVRWFPPGTWGKGKFDIAFSAGEFEVRLIRRTYKEQIRNSFSLSIVPAFRTLYETTLDAVRGKAKNPRPEEISLDFTVHQQVDKALTAGLSRMTGADFVRSQVFVPAGRSFFTSLGKMAAVFEQSATIDPTVTHFGKMFANYTDSYNFWPTIHNKLPSIRNQIEDILGGEIVQGREMSYVRTPDGRKVPFPILSSGQQELLPLLIVLDVFRYRSQNAKKIIFIEEPEAHLFPEAQSRLIDLLAFVLNGSDKPRMVLTTHSPYVLAKFNNLIKAGTIGYTAQGHKRSAVNEIVKRDRWLDVKKVAAYAICDGLVTSLIGQEELINADYLDSVSSSISTEFSRLLEIEFAGA